ncbi:ABC transporter ATP-binding protein [Heyndrickxia coagulans]|uniref:ABC transporter ATP-binding protein n=1 Tax=Heyndrickxia coagulans TaxID=1398 RepID=UPI00047B5A3B|nr:ABC transporter ATP-binding protein [Heyndrickxia coagulans]
MGTICELAHITKKYDDHVVLDDFQLSIEEGDMVAIMGKSGSGKTTVLNLIGLLERPNSGSIKLFGKDAPRVGSHRANLFRRNYISYLFQNFALIDGESIHANLEIPFAYSRKSLSEKNKLKQEALSRVGLDVSLNQKIFRLSGGEQQRVAIARILLKPSKLIIADEPTGSLDAENRDLVLHILQDLNKQGKTIIIATHDSAVSSVCGRVEFI